jgi:hypothetical protein
MNDPATLATSIDPALDDLHLHANVARPERTGLRTGRHLGANMGHQLCVF